jgi:hypothetical protein
MLFFGIYRYFGLKVKIINIANRMLLKPNFDKEEVEKINRHSICGKNELKWEVKKLFADFPSLTYIGLELLGKDIIQEIMCRMGEIDRNMAVLPTSQHSNIEK